MPRSGSPTQSFVVMMFAHFFCYLGMVMPLSVLSVYVIHDWGMSNFLGGVAAGAAFFITMFCRKPAGDLADRKGGKHCFTRGCLWYAAGGAVCLLAAWGALPLPARFAALIAGRLVLGVGESMTNVGMVHWSIGVMGVGRTGRILATIGMSMYASVAVGGQTGFVLFEKAGFAGMMAVSTLSPLVAFALAIRRPDAVRAVVQTGKSSLIDIMGRIWRLGVPAGFHAVGFAVLGAFLAKTFLDRNWEYAGLGLTCYGIGFVVMRLFIGHLPDRMGGLPVATASALVEMSGLYLLWLAPGPVAALIGSFLTGAGCSMIFPSLCLEIVKSVPEKLRGAAVGSYGIFQDIAYGFAGPAAGLFTDRWGDRIAYLFAALAATAGLAMILDVARRQRTVPDATT